MVFASDAMNLVPNDTTHGDDVFLVDRDPDANGTFDEGNAVTTRLSVDVNGAEANGRCFLPSISADGGVVLLLSDATNLLPGGVDTNGNTDAYVLTRSTGTWQRADVAANGSESSQGCEHAVLSGDGLVVAFSSMSSNLVTGDTNGAMDVFVNVLATGTVGRVSVSTSGAQARNSQDSNIVSHCLSHDGSRIAFSSTTDNFTANDGNGGEDVFVRDRVALTTECASVDALGHVGDQPSWGGTLDGDGRRVVYTSYATNLSANDLDGGDTDVYLHDFTAGGTTLVSESIAALPGVDSSSAGATLSKSGDLVLFASDASNLTDPFFVGGDYGIAQDVFVRDLATATTRYVTIGVPLGEEEDDALGPCAISADRRWVAFASAASNLVTFDNNGQVDVFVEEVATGRVVRVSTDVFGHDANGPSRWPSISADGRYVAFESSAPNLVPFDFNGSPDVFVHDRDPDGDGFFDEDAGVTVLVDRDDLGNLANAGATEPSMSRDGTRVAFASTSSNLDGDAISDVFVRDLPTGKTLLASVATNGTKGNAGSDHPSLSGDGTVVAFQSAASNLADASQAPDANGKVDVYWHDFVGVATARVTDVDPDGASFLGARALVDAPLGRAQCIAYSSDATNLVPNDTNGCRDVFVSDLRGAQRHRVLAPGGVEPNGACDAASISQDAFGAWVAFSTVATNFSSNDPNGVGSDVYLASLPFDGTTTRLASRAPGGATGNAPSRDPVVVTDDRLRPSVVFVSDASDLAGGDTNGRADPFLWQTAQGALWWNYGPGVAGTLGVPALTIDVDPVLGTTLDLDLGNSAGSATFVALCMSADWIDLGPSGPAFLVDLSQGVLFLLPLPPAGLTISGAVPNDPALVGATIYLQAIELDTGAFKKHAFTRGLGLEFGY